MAQQQPHGRPTNQIGFREIELLREETLGVGSYGAVCKARCDQLVCAAKIIHPTLVLPNSYQQISPQREHRLPIRRFEKECDFLKEIRHPNIIQYLGMYQDPETGLPVLLMELMDESLTHFLEDSAEPIPYHIQLIISLDIAQALSFLHLNGIIHRDLSSNNILLIGKGRAKLTDLGMAKFVDVRRTGLSDTTCPGTDAYMPPEAIDTQEAYTEKGDIFSFGVNIIQILTRKFPKPGNRFKTLRINHSAVPLGKIEVRVSEIERRNNHISEIDSARPLSQIALNCLKDEEGERPLASVLCQQLASLKDTAECVESERAIGDVYMMQQAIVAERGQQITELYQQLQSQQQVTTTTQEEIQSLREELSTAQATVRERERQQRDQEEMIARFQRRIEELELNPREQPCAQVLPSSNTATSRSSNESSSVESSTEEVIRLNWIQGKKAPTSMSRHTDAVVDDSVAYFTTGTRHRQVYAFDSTNDCWSALPDCLTQFSTLALVNGLLTTIGGLNSNQHLFSLIGEGEDKQWTNIFPPMITERYEVTAVCTDTALIVAGGKGEGRRNLKTVEIMNTNTQQWSTAADLPQAMHGASATVCGTHLYLMNNRSIIVCSIPALLQSCHPKIFEAQSSSPVSSSQDPIWSTIAHLPVECSTLVSINNHLLAIGGRDLHHQGTTSVLKHDPHNNRWQTISNLKTPRWQCFSVVLPNSKIMVVGGYTSQSLFGSETDAVEFTYVEEV